MCKLKVDLSELAFAFESNFTGTKNYFDLETGEVVAVGDDIRDDLEAIYAEMTEEGAEVSPTFAERVAQQGLPEWQQQQLLVADAVEAGYGERFVAVPQVESGEAYARHGGLHRHRPQPPTPGAAGRGDHRPRRVPPLQGRFVQLPA